MNDLDKVNDIAYLCGVDASGNPVLISKASLGSVVAPSVTATKGEVWIVYLDSNKIGFLYLGNSGLHQEPTL